ncbi:MAG: DNA-binding protein [Clostridia bacterium]|nr:DNA-binding protein [Clostridia bacterium]
MAKDLTLALLLDFYGGLLTEKQAFALDGYYNQDLSLAELAEDMGISRQGVRAFLSQGEKHLREFETKLGLAARLGEVSRGLAEMKEVISSGGDTVRLVGIIDRISDII